MIRLSYPSQYDATRIAIDAAMPFTANSDPGRPTWLEIHEVDVPDISSIIVVRFPGRAPYRPDEEEEPDAPRFRWAIGIYSVMIDQLGDPVHVSHSVAGTLNERLARELREKS
jgi:hypothetical protein